MLSTKYFFITFHSKNLMHVLLVRPGKSCQMSRDLTAVLACLVGFSKACNRIDHNIIITILGNLNIPTCALWLILSYGRRMCVRYNGEISGDLAIPGGGPQGGLLTVLLFNLQVNLAGSPCPITRLLPLLLRDLTLYLPLLYHHATSRKIF